MNVTISKLEKISKLEDALAQHEMEMEHYANKMRKTQKRAQRKATKVISLAQKMREKPKTQRCSTPDLFLQTMKKMDSHLAFDYSNVNNVPDPNVNDVPAPNVNDMLDKKSKIRRVKLDEETRELTQTLDQMNNLIEETRSSFRAATIKGGSCIKRCNSFEKDLESTKFIPSVRVKAVEPRIALPKDTKAHGFPVMDKKFYGKQSESTNLTDDTREVAQSLKETNLLIEESRAILNAMNIKKDSSKAKCNSLKKNRKTTKVTPRRRPRRISAV